jgi:stage IV sporulation protein FB
LVVAAALRLGGGTVGWTGEADVPPGVEAYYFLGRVVYWAPLASEAANGLLLNILVVNVYWGLINLLPVYPLDGGRIARELFTLRDPRRGIVLSLWVSTVTAAIVAAYVLLAWRSFFTALMFGYLAYSSHQTLGEYQSRRGF